MHAEQAEYYTQTPYISLLIVWSTVNDLGRGVGQSPTPVQSLLLETEYGSQAEVYHFEILLLSVGVPKNHDVVQFYVPMHNAQTVDMTQPFCQLLEKTPLQWFKVGLDIVADLRYEVLQGLTFNQLHYHCQVLVIFNAIVDSYNVWMVTGAEDLLLLPYHIQVLAREQGLVDVLHCHLHLMKLFHCYLVSFPRLVVRSIFLFFIMILFLDSELVFESSGKNCAEMTTSLLI